MTGKYSTMKDSYLSITNALPRLHTQPAEGVRIDVRYLDTTDFDAAAPGVLREQLHDVHGILVPGGYGARGTEGMIRLHPLRARAQRAGTWASASASSWRPSSSRARWCGVENAASTEFEPHTEAPADLPAARAAAGGRHSAAPSASGGH